MHVALVVIMMILSVIIQYNDAHVVMCLYVCNECDVCMYFVSFYACMYVRMFACLYVCNVIRTKLKIWWYVWIPFVTNNVRFLMVVVLPYRWTSVKHRSKNEDEIEGTKNEQSPKNDAGNVRFSQIQSVANLFVLLILFFFFTKAQRTHAVALSVFF